MSSRYYLGLLLLSLSGLSLSAGDWDRFRGPSHDGRSPETNVFKGKSNVGLKINWKTDAGSAYSDIIVKNGHVITAYTKGDNDFLTAWDEKSGKVRWTYDLGPMYKGHDGSHDGMISTPFASDKAVFMQTAQGKLISFNLKTGEVLWSKDQVAEEKGRVPFYGYGTSPVIVDNVLITSLAAENQSIAGYNPETGERLWTLGSGAIAQQSPIIINDNGQSLVTFAMDNQLIAFTAKDGKQVWSFEHSGRTGEALQALHLEGDKIFLNNKRDGSELFKRNDQGVYESAWQTRFIRNSYAIPVYHNGYIYSYSVRILTCVDAKTGELQWRSRQPGDGFLSLVDDHLVILTKAGSLHVAPASPDGWQELASAKVFDDVSWCMPAFANGSIYVRSMKEIARVDITKQASLLAAAENQDQGTSFGAFLDKLGTSTNKKAEVEKFMAKNTKMPLIEGDTVHFIYHGKAKDMSIGGDIFGARQEKTMHRAEGTDLFYYSVKLPEDVMSSYIFIKDFSEFVRDPHNKRETETTLLGEDMEFNGSGKAFPRSWFSMPKWQAPTFLTPGDAPKGKMEVHEVAIDEKTKLKLHVYLPAGYAQSKENYPVVYVHDGKEALEKGDWTTALDNLMNKDIVPVITVFLDGNLGRPTLFANVLAEKVVPLVDQTYRSKKDRYARANVGIGNNIGHALFGTLFNTDLFAKAGVQSAFISDYIYPAFGDKLDKKSDTTVYLDWGRYDLRNPQEAWAIKDGNLEFARHLEKKGFKTITKEFPEGSDWISWRNRTKTLLMNLFPKNNS